MVIMCTLTKQKQNGDACIMGWNKEKDNNKREYDIMRKSEWYKERFIGFPKYLKFTKVFILCENMKDFLQNVDKSDYRIIAYNPPGYVIELFWSGMAKDEVWIVAYSDIANICEWIEK